MTKKTDEVKKGDRKAKQIVVRFDQESYDKISALAKAEHRGLGEFVRHAALHYVENSGIFKAASGEKGGEMTWTE